MSDQHGPSRSPGPSEAAVAAAVEVIPVFGVEDGDVRAGLAAAHDPALGLDRSVCLRDVVEALDVARLTQDWEGFNRAYLKGGSSMSEEHGQTKVGEDGPITASAYIASMALGDLGNDPCSEVIGVYSTLEKAWDAAMREAPATGSVERVEVDGEPFSGQTLRWREWDHRTHKVITRNG